MSNDEFAAQPPVDMFERFTKLANPNGLHPEDNMRLFDYIIVMHRTKLKYTTDELRGHMTRAHFSDEVADEVVDTVEVGLELLAYYDANGGAAR